MSFSTLGCERVTQVAWLSLAAIHLIPAAVLLRPSLVSRLYQVSVTDTTGSLLVHRGALFLSVAVAAGWAAFMPSTRRLGSVLVGISVLGFLLIHFKSGRPAALNAIAMTDAVALVPLGWVLLQAWSAAGAPHVTR